MANIVFAEVLEEDTRFEIRDNGQIYFVNTDEEKHTSIYGLVWMNYRNYNVRHLFHKYFPQNIDGEVWKDLYINTLVYEISNVGNRIRNKTTGDILTPQIDGCGYYSVCVTDEQGHHKRIKYHRAKAISFIPNLQNKTCIDHIDRNKKNNDLSNLRWCSKSENAMNQSHQLNTTSRYRGVHFDTINNKWQAQIRHNYKKIYLGRFKTEKDAALAYNQKALELFGEYANLNIISP